MSPFFKRRCLFVNLAGAHRRWPGLCRLMVFSTVLLVCGIAAQYLGAQDIFGRISGTVIDPTGAVVANAKITVTNEETKLRRSTTADDKGFYVIPELPVGV